MLTLSGSPFLKKKSSNFAYVFMTVVIFLTCQNKTFFSTISVQEKVFSSLTINERFQLKG